MASSYDAEGEALAERLMLAELIRLTPPPLRAATVGLSLSAPQLELLARLNAALREEYALRRAMLLKRLARRLPFASHAPARSHLALPNRRLALPSRRLALPNRRRTSSSARSWRVRAPPSSRRR